MIAVEIDHPRRLGDERPPDGIGERELDRAVAENVRDGISRQLVIDRDGHRTHAHDAEVGGNELEAILRENADARTAADAAAKEPARDRDAQRIEFERGELAHRPLLAQVDQGNSPAVPRQAQHIAEIAQIR
jgi:hypothetical protein